MDIDGYEKYKKVWGNRGAVPYRIPGMKDVIFTMTIWVDGQPQTHEVQPTRIEETDWGKRYGFDIEFNLADYDKLHEWHRKQNDEVAEMVKKERERIKQFFEEKPKEKEGE